MASNRHNIAGKLLGPERHHEAYGRLLYDLMRRCSEIGFNYDNQMPTSASGSNEDRLLIVIDTLKQNVDKPRGEISQIIQAQLGAGSTGKHIDHLMETATQAIAMIDPTAGDWHAGDFVMGGYRPSSWQQDESFLSFCSRSIPLSSPEAVDAAQTALREKSSLKAKKLQKRLGIQFCATDDLAEHLLLEQRHGKTRLYLFHHAGYVKALLDRTESLQWPMDCGMEHCLKNGALPPQLLVETLHSMQAVLFPSTNPEEVAILRELIRKREFDSECVRYEGYKVFKSVPKDFRYVYWAERLAVLYRRLEEKPPRNRLEKWLEQEGSDGNAFLIAFLALVISILVGILSLILACFQTWISWMAWKYPASN